MARSDCCVAVLQRAIKVKCGNLEQSGQKQCQPQLDKLRPLFLVCIVSMKGEFGSNKDGWVT